MWLGRAGAIIVGIGAVGVLIFGIWLAIERTAYHPWDGWILASLIFWVIAVGTGQRAGRSFQRAAMDPDDAAVLRRTGLQLQTVAGISLILHPRPHGLEARRVTLADIRPDGAWEASLFLHVLGAMLLVGGLFVVSASLDLRVARPGGRRRDAALRRFAYLTLFFVVLPAFFAMRIGAAWVLERVAVQQRPELGRHRVWRSRTPGSSS